jgi:hypothetical protein
VLVLILVGLLAFWTVGGVALRSIGGLLCLAAGVGLLFGPGGQTGALVLVAAIGAVLWLSGHWHFAHKFGFYKSPLAHRMLDRPPGVQRRRGRRRPDAAVRTATHPSLEARPEAPAAELVPAALTAKPARPVSAESRPARWPARRRGTH